jgi:pyruvate dehydrogenase phosphatase
MLAPTKVSEMLTENERTYTVTRPGNPLYRYDTNSVASNPTCEDAQAFTIFEHEGKDYILASVFDGHSGFWTSRLMSENLEKYIARELFEVLRGGYKSLTVSGDSWWNWLWHTGSQKPKIPNLDTASQPAQPLSAAQVVPDDRSVILPQALRTAFNLADRDLIQPPIDYLKTLEAGSSRNSPLQLTEEQRRYGLSLLQPALSGSCGLSALLDTSSANLYVALAGDSRAVMGTYDSETKKWKVDVLSEDQTGRNLKEVERMKKEHPKNEEETVIMRGRVLGGLEPTRSFGDGKYKL